MFYLIPHLWNNSCLNAVVLFDKIVFGDAYSFKLKHIQTLEQSEFSMIQSHFIRKWNICIIIICVNFREHSINLECKWHKMATYVVIAVHGQMLCSILPLLHHHYKCVMNVIFIGIWR